MEGLRVRKLADIQLETHEITVFRKNNVMIIRCCRSRGEENSEKPRWCCSSVVAEKNNIHLINQTSNTWDDYEFRMI